MKELERRRFEVPAFAARRLGWWLLVAPSIGGIALFCVAIADSVIEFPSALVMALFLTVPLIAAWLGLLRIPQLWARISGSGAGAAMLWGGGAAVGIYALPANSALLELLAQYAGVDFAYAWGAALVAPLTEETAKAFAVGVVVLASQQRLRTPMDAALLAGYSAVGFTATEDVLYSLNVAWLNLGEGPLVSTLLVYLLRAVVFGLVTHVVFSVFVGAGLGVMTTGDAPKAKRLGQGAALIAAGYGLHGLWNSPLLLSWWARFVYAAAVPLVMWWLLTELRRLEHSWFEATLASPGALDGLDQSLPSIVKHSWWARRDYRNRVARAWGKHTVVPQREAEALLTDLADAVASEDQFAAKRLRAELASRTATKAT